MHNFLHQITITQHTAIVHDGHWSDWSEWSGNCEWDACVGLDRIVENDQQLEGSGENVEFDDGVENGNGENVKGIIGSKAHALLAQALGTRTRLALSLILALLSFKPI